MGQLVGWARVSTKDQSLEAQEATLLEAGAEKLFSSKHSGKGSGDNVNKLAELIDYVRAGDVVLVTKLDRLGRSLRDVLNTVDLLRDKGVALRTLEQPIDTTKDDAFSNAMLQLMGVFAEMERTFIVERTQAGREASGRLGGRPKKISERKRKEIVERVTAGETQAALASEFDVSRQAINSIIRAAR